MKRLLVFAAVCLALLAAQPSLLAQGKTEGVKKTEMMEKKRSADSRTKEIIEEELEFEDSYNEVMEYDGEVAKKRTEEAEIKRKGEEKDPMEMRGKRMKEKGKTMKYKFKMKDGEMKEKRMERSDERNGKMREQKRMMKEKSREIKDKQIDGSPQE